MHGIEPDRVVPPLLERSQVFGAGFGDHERLRVQRLHAVPQLRQHVHGRALVVDRVDRVEAQPVDLDSRASTARRSGSPTRERRAPCSPKRRPRPWSFRRRSTARTTRRDRRPGRRGCRRRRGSRPARRHGRRRRTSPGREARRTRGEAPRRAPRRSPNPARPETLRPASARLLSTPRSASSPSRAAAAANVPSRSEGADVELVDHEVVEPQRKRLRAPDEIVRVEHARRPAHPLRLPARARIGQRRPAVDRDEVVLAGRDEQRADVHAVIGRD